MTEQTMSIEQLMSENARLRREVQVWEKTCEIYEKQKEHALDLLYTSNQEVKALKAQLLTEGK